MKKKIASLFLALALCVGLCVPASAASSGELIILYSNPYSSAKSEYADVTVPLGTPASGAGWSYDGGTTLTLSGINAYNIWMQGDLVLVLADGTTNVVSSSVTAQIALSGKESSENCDITIRGGGTLEGYSVNGKNVTINGGTISVNSCSAGNGALTINGGTTTVKSLSAMAGYSQFYYNGGTFIVDGEVNEFGTPPIWERYLASAEDAGCLGVLTFYGADGQPLTYQITTENSPSGTKYVRSYYNSDGTVATYAILSSAGQTAPSTSSTFTDVSAGQYFYEPVMWAVDKGITNGTTATTFSPYNTCTKAQIITYLYRAAGSPSVSGSNPFNDVSESVYYYDAARWAYSQGMVEGDTFTPNVPCTRAMAVEFMWKQAGSPSASGAAFTDVSSGASYAAAVSWAVEQGVTNGTTATTFAPDTTCTRGQIVTFLYRAFAE